MGPHKTHNIVGRTFSGPTAASTKPHRTVGRTLSDPIEDPTTKQSSLCKNSSIPSRISRPTVSVSGKTLQSPKNKLIHNSVSDSKNTVVKNSVNKNENNSERSNFNKDKGKINSSVNKNVINALKSKPNVNITNNKENNDIKDNENVDKTSVSNIGGANINKQCDLKREKSENENKIMSCKSSSDKTVILKSIQTSRYQKKQVLVLMRTIEEKQKMNL